METVEMHKNKVKSSGSGTEAKTLKSEYRPKFLG